MTNARQGTIAVPYKYVNTLARGMTVNIEFEGYDAETYGVANGVITATSQYTLTNGRRQRVHGTGKDNRLQV